MGHGTLPQLLKHCPDGVVDAVVITHEHSDHCVDLNGLLRVRYFSADRGERIPLLCTPGVLNRIDALEPNVSLMDVFDVRALPSRQRIGPFALESFPLPHHVPNVGVRLEAPGVTVAYTGDTGPDPALAELARDVDLFIAEATLQEPVDPPHLSTAAEAGEWAARAGAHRLLLTHFWPGTDRATSVAQAREHFDGEVIAAEEDLVVHLEYRTTAPA
jgi:ribonuclease BN (tRNA processing enzyme)